MKHSTTRTNRNRNTLSVFSVREMNLECLKRAIEKTQTALLRAMDAQVILTNKLRRQREEEARQMNKP